MKLKGLAKVEADLLKLQDIISKQIDDLYDEPPGWEEKDQFLNHAYMELDEALEAIKRLKEMKLEHYR